MDILTHTVSGLAAGAVIAGFGPWGRGSGGFVSDGRRSRGFGSQFAIVAASGVGGALPDIDAATYLLGDGTYSGHLWYSHHGFFHSLAAAGLFALLIGCAIWIFGLFKGRDDWRGRGLRSWHWLLLGGFVCGFVLHLLEDMPTPASTWGGVRLFFPSGEYIGGTGQIWWWNNYDIFLVACGVFVLCGGLLLVQRWLSSWRCLRWSRWVSVGVFAAGCVVCAVQISSREVDFAYTGHTDKFAVFEEASKAEQRRILGERLYRAMEWFDRAVPGNF